jgi:transglutaminase-like putative cysteine protease
MRGRWARKMIATPYALIQIPDGPEGTREVLKHMRELAREAVRDPWFRELADRIIAPVPPKAFRREIRALFNFVRRNVRYTLDTNEIEVIQPPKETLRRGAGDCDDMCILLGALCEQVGHPAKFSALGFEQDRGYTHVIVLSSPAGDGPWLSLDATENRPMGWFPPGVTWMLNAEIAQPWTKGTEFP